MSIPNTTPTPNIIFNGLMKDMNDTEFRLVMLVVRATLGWEADKITGMRKTEDWISSRQLKEKTGRQSGALSKAIERCIQKDWIEARSKDGEILNTKGKRKGKNLYFRLGKAIMFSTSSLSEEVVVKDKSTSSLSANAESANAESEDYKRNTLQNKNLTKTIAGSTFSPAIEGNKENINSLLNIFYDQINPSLNYANKTQRAALQWLIDKYGYEKTRQSIEYAISIQGKEYAPTITTPYQLKDKLSALLVYYAKNNNTSKFGVHITK